jgi:hypothetical protein
MNSRRSPIYSILPTTWPRLRRRNKRATPTAVRQTTSWRDSPRKNHAFSRAARQAGAAVYFHGSRYSVAALALFLKEIASRAQRPTARAQFPI